MIIKNLRFSELINFQPKQLRALETLFTPECKYFLYGGAAYGGKSYFLRWVAVALAMYYFKKYGIKQVPIGLFSEDYPTLKDRQIIKIKREMPLWLGRLKNARDEGYMFELTSEYGGGQVLLRNLDDPSKYASSEFAAILVEELTKNVKDTFDDLRFRLRYPGISDVKFVGATNPGQRGHGWVKDKWIDKDPRKLDPERERFFFIQSLPTDNKHLDPGYLEQLKSLPERKRKMLLEGSWDIVAGAVFSQFDRQTHVIDNIIPDTEECEHVMWMDWGLADPAYFACYLSAIVKQKLEDGRVFNRIITYQEWYLNDMNFKDISPRTLAAHIYQTAKTKKISKAWVDPSMTGRVSDGSTSISSRMEKEWKRLNGKKWVRLTGAGNDRISGWAVMQDWMNIAPDELPYWVITKGCPNLIRTLPILVYDENKLSKGKNDVDTTQDDHGADACRYGITNVKFISVKPGSYSAIRENKKVHLKTDEHGLPIIDVKSFFGTIS